MTSPLTDALAADGPAADRAAAMALYGWLVGAWDLDVIEYRDDGSTRRRPGEWQFGWALEGRAVQDVWIVPPRGQRAGDAVANSNRYGTTLRTYDPRIDAWHIQWTDPVSQTYLTMIDRREGDDIVQHGTNAAGQAVRWSFREITPDAFRWLGEVSDDGGASYHLVVEFSARRIR
jgi:hypothetical protein